MSRRLLGGFVVAAMLGAPRAYAQGIDLLVPLPELEARAARDSLDPGAQYDVALGYWFSRRFDDAERALRRSIAIEPKFAPSCLGLAYLPFARRPKLWKEMREGRVPEEARPAFDEAVRLYQRAFLLDPMVDLKVYALVMPPRPALVVGFNADRTYVALVHGFEAFWSGDYEASLNHLERVLGEFRPKHEADIPRVLLWYHGLAAAHVNRYDVAISDFRTLLNRALALERTDSVQYFTLASNQVRYVLATLYRRGQRPDEAIALYQESLSNDLGLFAAHSQLADIFEEREQWIEAVAERQRAIDAFPDNSSLRYELGRTLAHARDFTHAATVLSEAMEANPSNPRIPYSLGLVQLRLGDQPGARRTLARFVAMAPSRFSSQVREVQQQLAKMDQAQAGSQ
ncbi:MAG TPA: tetratricopeptide repeat protein [Gemmatimonadales bacterium]|nr:tetratricopeptide repeat protein [Gemmatimonadales bacterium]